MKKVVGVVLGFIFIAGTFIFISPTIKEHHLIPPRMYQLANPDSLLNARSTNSRVERYPVSLEMFREHPVGVGTGNWAYYHNLLSSVAFNIEDYPHNIFLEILNESGVITFLFFLLLLVRTFYLMLIVLKNKRVNAGYFGNRLLDRLYDFLVVYFIFYLINANISGDLSDGRFLFFSMTAIMGMSEKYIRSTKVQASLISISK